MKFICADDCIDSGDLSNLSRLGTPITHNYRRERVYDISEAQLRRLTAIGLFPECFEFADDGVAQAWVEAHNDELCDIVDARVLPYRKLTPEEEENDRLIALGKKEGKFTLPHGVIAKSRPALIRRGRTAAQTVIDPNREAPAAGGPIELIRKEKPAEVAAPAPAKPAEKKNGRKPMSAEARKAAGERLAAARAKKKAAQPVAAG